ncbi:hypothetical protein [Cellulomonas denverensis]|uniref:hypothetical protein n=1 Tax=Cellulomonas denverensis TaxID=264297 RepID=UPI0019455AD5|nr:hypothetical protein [Cellulomonas denverensis]GIG25768.1 hypothetical protein Cde04nite_20120 [Cellulomonas denverensis]
MNAISIAVGAVPILAAAALAIWFTPASKWIEGVLEYVNPYKYVLPRRTFMAAIIVFLTSFGVVIACTGFE